VVSLPSGFFLSDSNFLLRDILSWGPYALGLAQFPASALLRRASPSIGSGRYVESSEMSSLPIGLRLIGLEAPSGNRESKREDFQFPILLLLIVPFLGLLLLEPTAPLPITLPLPLSLTCDDSNSFGTGEAFSTD